MNEYLIFLGVVLVATISPGPAVFLSLKNGARYPYIKALLGVWGNITALLLFATLSALGLGTILIASPRIFLALKIAGGLYLCYLGFKLWTSKPSKEVSLEPSENLMSDEPIPAGVSNLAVYQEGLLVGITNPKTIVFFTALFPQFISFEQAFIQQFLILALTIAFFSFFFLAIYTALSSSVRKFLNQPQVMNVFNRLVGTVFIGYGVGLLFYGK